MSDLNMSFFDNVLNYTGVSFSGRDRYSPLSDSLSGRIRYRAGVISSILVKNIPITNFMLYKSNKGNR